jgi:hypothetical protein
MKGASDKLKYFETVCLILMFVDHQRKNRQQHCGNYTCVKISQFLKCHRVVTKQTNPLQVDNLITNKFVSILEASRRILNTQCVDISVYCKSEKCSKTL